MEIGHIENLKRINKARESPVGYMTNKDNVRISTSNMKFLAITGIYNVLPPVLY